MKKKKILITTICSFLLIFNVKADMGSPMSLGYEGIINNPKGTQCRVQNYDEEKDNYYYTNVKMDYGKKVDVSYDYTKGGITYATIKLDDNGNTCDAVIKDVIPYKEKYTKEDYIEHLKDEYGNDYDENYGDEDFSDKFELYVFNKKGVEIYNGPSLAYSKTGTVIPPNTTIKYGISDDLWVYVTYNKTSGWVYTYQNVYYSPYGYGSGIANVFVENKEYPEDSYYIILANNEYLKDYPTDDSANIGTKIKSYTKLRIIYEYYEDKSYKWIYTEYNGQKGWIKITYSSGNIVYKYTNKKLIINDAPMYTSPLSDSKITGTIIPKGTEVESSYFYRVDSYLDFGWYKVKYNGDEGWIKNVNSFDDYSLEYETEVASYEVSELKVKETVLYSSPSTSSKKLNQINNKNIKSTYSIRLYDPLVENEETGDYGKTLDWYYVEESGVKGWVNVDYENVVLIEKLEESEVVPSTPEKEAIIEEKKEETETTPTKNVNTNTLSKEDIIFYSLFGTIILGLVTLVIILLINKKKSIKLNNKELSDKEEAINEKIKK